MKISTAKQVMIKFLDLRLPFFLHGKPGVGKSSLVNQISKEWKPKGITLDVSPLWKEHLIDERASNLDATDVKGFPIPNRKRKVMEWIPPEWIPQDGYGILFLDEINLAPPAIQSGLYQLILDRKSGNAKLGDGWSVAAAGNYETDRCNVYKMSAALSSRFACHIDVECDSVSWSEWAIQNGIHPAIIAFVRLNPGLLHDYDPSTKTFPCPRTWEYLSHFVKTLNGEPEEMLIEVFPQIIGKPGVMFSGFWRNYKRMPNPLAILNDPINGWIVPSDIQTNSNNMQILFSVCIALSKLVEKKTFKNLITFLDRLPMQEFSAMTINDSVLLNPKLKETSEYIGWVTKNGGN